MTRISASDQSEQPHLLRPDPGQKVKIDITPSSVGWRDICFSVIELAPGETHSVRFDDRELAVVPIEGSATVNAGSVATEMRRESVFTQMPTVLYAPPKTDVHIQAGETSFTFAVGSAPAVGLYPVRLFLPSEMKSELRGGGTSYRQVNHILAMPLPAEHLILYEVYVPRGTWAGWAPHCHDGRDGSPYLEEVYYFRMQPANGFLLHRNWREDENFDEQFVAHDGDAVVVTKGFHSTVACPTSHLYFLNYLAGDLEGDNRATPPCFHADYTWIQDDWNAGAWQLPVVTP
jgi:5-deoxy-glucuronate isomerase